MPEGQKVGEKTPRTSSFSILTSMMPRQVMLSASSYSMSNGSKAIPSLTAEQRKLLLQAVCQFLELNGFSKTLKKLLSEAQIEKDSSKNSSVNLEDMCSQYLAMRASSDGDDKNTKKLDKQNDEITGVGNGTESITSKDKAKKEKKKQSKTHTEGNDVEASQQSEIVKNCDEDANLKSKKKKSSSNDSLPNVEDTPFEDVTRDEKSSKKSKEKKKSKSGPDSSVENLKQKLEEGLQRVKEESKISSDAEKKSKSKSEKKMKVSSSIEIVEDKNGENKQGDDTNESGDHEDGMKKEKKSSKKRKRVSEENEVEELQQSKTDGSTEMKVSDSKEDNMVESQTPAAGKHSNGFLEHNGGDKSTGQKSSKKQKTAGSTEPKSVNAFRRVDPDKVVIDDERLQDNSYWAKDGADSGYGAKAQEILGQVRGRDFRHEKTKKKRGSYRGGQIDQNSHSIKFNYSDEDE